MNDLNNQTDRDCKKLPEEKIEKVTGGTGEITTGTVEDVDLDTLRPGYSVPPHHPFYYPNPDGYVVPPHHPDPLCPPHAEVWPDYKPE